MSKAEDLVAQLRAMPIELIREELIRRRAEAELYPMGPATRPEHLRMIDENGMPLYSAPKSTQ